MSIPKIKHVSDKEKKIFKPFLAAMVDEDSFHEYRLNLRKSCCSSCS